MRPVVRDNTRGGNAVLIDWLRLTPYASTGTFTSRVLDAGAVRSWSDASWTADVPAGSTLVLSVRTGNTATPGTGWTGFTPVPSSGATIGRSSRYLQYRITLSTTNTSQTPVFRDFTVRYGA